MKRLVYILILTAGSIFSACNKDNDPILEDPDSRLIATLAEYESALTSAPNGWKGEIFPIGGKGFTYYLKFNAGKVTMISDFNATTAVTPAESTYRLKALQRPTLIFDTYSYIHLPSDPNGTVSGGTTGQGLQSDFEFAIVEVKTDTIKLQGAVRGNTMVLTKLDAQQETGFLSSGIKAMMDFNSQYLITNKFPYLQFEDGIKISLSMNPTTKSVSLTYVDASDVSKTLGAKFAYTLTGFTLSSPLVYGSNRINDFYWDSSTSQYYILNGSTRINVQNSPTPVIPLRVLFGAGKDYSQIDYDPLEVVTGLSADFNARYATAKAGLAAVGGANRTLDYIRVIFPIDNPVMILRFYYRNTAGSSFQANMTYNMTRTADGVFDFTYLASDGNATVVGGGLVALRDYFDVNQFRLDWVANPSAGATYGGLYVTTNPASFFYGTLIK